MPTPRRGNGFSIGTGRCAPIASAASRPTRSPWTTSRHARGKPRTIDATISCSPARRVTRSKRTSHFLPFCLPAVRARAAYCVTEPTSVRCCLTWPGRLLVPKQLQGRRVWLTLTTRIWIRPTFRFEAVLEELEHVQLMLTQHGPAHFPLVPFPLRQRRKY